MTFVDFKLVEANGADGELAVETDEDFFKFVILAELLVLQMGTVSQFFNLASSHEIFLILAALCALGKAVFTADPRQSTEATLADNA